jgi:hypothetical protein
MSEVSGTIQRTLGLQSFTDITDVPLVAIRRDGVTFDGDLTPEQADAVWARMTSRDDAHQARRTSLDTRRKAVMAAINPLEVGDPLKVIGTAVAQLIDIELNKPA